VRHHRKDRPALPHSTRHQIATFASYLGGFSGAAPSERTRPARLFSAFEADDLRSSLAAMLNSRRLGGFSGVVFPPGMTTFPGTQALFMDDKKSMCYRDGGCSAGSES
jgi:hypothetical protein